MSKRGENDGRGPKQTRVVRRSPADRKRLPKDLEAFAGGDDDAIWRRRGSRRIDDPRPVLMVPGVANRDARAVFDARLKRTERAIAAGDDERLGIELAEAARMQLWRGRSIVNWGAYLTVLGLEPERAEALRDEAAAAIGGAEVASEPVIAVWMRAEAGLLEACGVTAPAVGLRGAPGDERLVFEVPIDRAPDALSQMGRRATPLAREQADAPDSVVDRPKGVGKLSRLIERDMKRDEEDR